MIMLGIQINMLCTGCEYYVYMYAQLAYEDKTTCTENSVRANAFLNISVTNYLYLYTKNYKGSTKAQKSMKKYKKISRDPSPHLQ